MFLQIASPEPSKRGKAELFVSYGDSTPFTSKVRKGNMLVSQTLLRLFSLTIMPTLDFVSVVTLLGQGLRWM